ncbi:MAG: hypothetical protein GY816_16150 [Cytophagales bacterium]|nr:hypothetical protein [Cytophagales bacterium]
MTKTKRQLEETLAEMGQKMDQLIEEMKEHKQEITEEIEQKIKELKDKMDDISDDSKGFGEKAKERWGDAKPHLDEAAKEIGLAFKMFGKKN